MQGSIVLANFALSTAAIWTDVALHIIRQRAAVDIKFAKRVWYRCRKRA